MDKDYETPDGLVVVYVHNLLPLYIGMKEFERIILKRSWKRRPGEKLVMLWLFILFSLCVANYIDKSIELPESIIKITASVITFYFGSRILKMYARRKINLKESSQSKNYRNYPAITTMMRE